MNQLKSVLPCVTFSLAQVTPMDDDGYFNWGLHNSCCYLQATTAKTCIVEVNENIPYAYGGNMERIHISQVTSVVEGENTPLAELPKLKLLTLTGK